MGTRGPAAFPGPRSVENIGRQLIARRIGAYSNPRRAPARQPLNTTLEASFAVAERLCCRTRRWYTRSLVRSPKPQCLRAFWACGGKFNPLSQHQHFCWFPNWLRSCKGLRLLHFTLEPHTGAANAPCKGPRSGSYSPRIKVPADIRVRAKGRRVALSIGETTAMVTRGDVWPAAGFLDTEMGCFMMPKVGRAAWRRQQHGVAADQRAAALIGPVPGG